MLSDRTLSPASHRNTALPVTGVGIACATVALGSVMAAVALTEMMLGGGLDWPSMSRTVRVLGVAGGDVAPTSSAERLFADHAAQLWVVVGLLLSIGLGLAVCAAAWWWRHWGPTPNGHATRPDIRSELSERAARRSALRTRPGLGAEELRVAPAGEIGIPMHRYGGIELRVPFTNLTGTIAPTQSGKSRKDLVHKILEAPGALLCSTTKPDLAEFCALARARRPLAGPVIVYDAAGRVRWPAPLHCSPIIGCGDQQEASRRAYTLVESAALQVEAGGGGGAGNDRVFRERAVVVLTAYLVAAAVAPNRTVDHILKWATVQPQNQAAGRFPVDDEPVELLNRYGRTAMAKNLAAEMRMDPRTASAVWMSVRRVVGPWSDPRIRDLCIPPPGLNLDLRRFISQGGSLFLIADQQQAAEAVPLLTNLTERWLRTAQDLALDFPSRRLDPPATAVLDELANGTPVPRLPEVVSDAAGRGLVVHWAAQSLAQLQRIFGPVGAREVLDNTTTFSVWGGVKDDETLRWVSDLCGAREVLRRQTQTDNLLSGLLGGSRHSSGEQIEPVFRPAEVRNLRRGRVIILHRLMRCFVADVSDVSDRPDAAELLRDVERLRTGDLGHYRTTVTPSGSERLS